MSRVLRRISFRKLFKVVLVFVVTIIVIKCNIILLSTSLYSGGNEVTQIDTDINDLSRTPRSADTHMTDNVPPPGYLVWTDHCRMPDVDPFTPDAMAIFEKKNYSSCSNQLPLIKVVFNINSRTYSLHIDQVAKHTLVDSDDDVACCYESVIRTGTGFRIDKDYNLTECEPFGDGYEVPPDIESLIITCMSVKENTTRVQKDAHFILCEKPEVRERLKTSAMGTDKERPISVLLMGIDSMSRFNLRRTMPETAAKLLNNSWFEMSGYNKIADNTLPNLMAILNGYNLTTAFAKCNLPNYMGGLDDCNFIWDLFRQNGYVTGYLEDETWMSTFNFAVPGFVKVPVDYYPRPFLMAIEDHLDVKKLSGMKFCVGLRHSAEYVYDFALDLATRYKGEPYFGLFWTNSFSHEFFDDASIMDTRIVRYIDEMEERGILDDSIVIFLSDHGSRYGALRSLKQGFLEERLPFVFIWLPLWFQEKHPDFAQALRVNRHRLTNPYDIHMTLKHIIELSGRTGKLPQAVGCPKCQSLFVPVPEERSCKDIAIDDHWCTCIPYANVEVTDDRIVNATNAVLAHLNAYLESGKHFPQCIPLKLEFVEEGQIRLEDTATANIYRIRFVVQSDDEAKFEASVAYARISESYDIIGKVSRLDSYEKSSNCINDNSAKMYCICDEEYAKGLSIDSVPIIL